MSDPGTPEWLAGLTDPVEIGRGGFGVVYKATETDLNRKVAVKVLSGNLDELARQRFDRERRAMGALSGHPNIVSIYRSGITPDGRPYLVMEFLPGGSMAERVEREGGLPWRDAVDVGVRLSAALETAHRAGVLHRDVKPENVFVSALGAPKLGDFGIARLEGAPQTQSAMITASLAHAAPELIDGKPPSVQTDVYSLASTLITLITGRPPFSRDTDESIVPMLARIATEPVPDLRATGVPGSLCDVFARAMAKDPAARHESVAAFGRALQDVQRTEQVPVTPLEVQGIDPTLTQGLGAPRAADATVTVAPAPAAPAAAPAVPAGAASPPPGATPNPGVAPHPGVTPNPGMVVAAATGPAPGTVSGPHPAPASGRNNTVLVLGLAAVATLIVGTLVVLVLGGGSKGGSSATSTTVTSAPTGTSELSLGDRIQAIRDGEIPPTTPPPGSEGLNGFEVSEIPFDLGDDRQFDLLALQCSVGLMFRCDQLANQAPVGSNYEQFGGTCGDRTDYQLGVDCNDRPELD